MFRGFSAAYPALLLRPSIGEELSAVVFSDELGAAPVDAALGKRWPAVGVQDLQIDAGAVLRLIAQLADQLP